MDKLDEQIEKLEEKQGVKKDEKIWKCQQFWANMLVLLVYEPVI